ncbi:hypothetical protein [Mycolicibacterium rhodesiae]|uniref:Uncharacterized protein n=1 Tax=Mycolicibacterium rhodesiae TaxID=36814 RepID=A0A1X0IMH8_MYCRH|nr:hypothetical protein [Mycolicibacterium rhodesiae]MCV7344385.1 hypothetical protein [Mycolicibacterium rhodesiae]ORB48665.1 hypothetical protein BST42_24880 [Mycolicibacterium rhodesiae]
MHSMFVKGVVLAALAVGAAVAPVATAAADDLPPADPAMPAPPPPQGFVPPMSTISDSVNGFAGILGGPAGNQLMLGQTPTPALVGTAPSAPPSADILNGAQLLMAQNNSMPTPDQQSPYQLGPGADGPFARVNQWKGVHAFLHGALGRMPADQLGQPLPGTAPPPGVNIPAGPEQFLPDPAAPPPPGAPGVPPAPAAPADPALLPPPPAPIP